jgi:hypothetical protein
VKGKKKILQPNGTENKTGIVMILPSKADIKPNLIKPNFALN